MLGNYLAIGPEIHVLQNVWATVERNPVGPNTLGAEEVAEFIDRLDAAGPPSAVALAERLPRERPGDLRHPDLPRGDGQPTRTPSTPSTRSAPRFATPSAGSASGTARGSPTRTIT